MLRKSKQILEETIFTLIWINTKFQIVYTSKMMLLNCFLKNHGNPNVLCQTETINY